MIKRNLLYLAPLLLGVLTVIVDFLPENLPETLADYRNVQDVQNVNFTLPEVFRIVFFFSWLFTYIAIILGKGKYLYICALSFICFIVTKYFFGPIVTTAEIGILQQLTIFSIGIALGIVFKSGKQ